MKHKIFRYPKVVTHRRVPLWNFSAVWDKKFLTENRDTPSFLPSPLPPLIHYFFSLPDIFWNTDQKGSSTKFFGTLRQTIFDRKSWHNPLKRKIFRYPKVVTHWRVPLRNFLAVWDKNFRWLKIVILPSLLASTLPPLIHTLFRYRKFSETQHRRVPLRRFSLLSDKKFRRKIVNPPSLIPNIFRYPKSMKH